MVQLERNAAYWLVTAGAAGWVGLTLLAPLGRHEGWLAAPFIYLFFDLICHQLPERSFHLFTEPLAVCHRCFGLYFGMLLGLLLLPVLGGIRRWLRARPWVVALFVVPMLIDVALITVNTPSSRFITGVVASFPVALLVWLGVTELARTSRSMSGESGAQPCKTS